MASFAWLCCMWILKNLPAYWLKMSVVHVVNYLITISSSHLIEFSNCFHKRSVIKGVNCQFLVMGLGDHEAYMQFEIWFSWTWKLVVFQISYVPCFTKVLYLHFLIFIREFRHIDVFCFLSILVCYELCYRACNLSILVSLCKELFLLAFRIRACGCLPPAITWWPWKYDRHIVSSYFLL
jgi:hypothetical protein